MARRYCHTEGGLHNRRLPIVGSHIFSSRVPARHSLATSHLGMVMKKNKRTVVDMQNGEVYEENITPITPAKLIDKLRDRKVVVLDNGTKFLSVEMIEEWLTNQHCTLWMDWDISKPARRRLAAEWTLDLYRTLQKLEKS